MFSSGGVYAWFKLRAEKGQIVVSAAQGAVIVQSGVLKDIQEAYDRLSDDFAQLKMESIAREEEIESCQGRIRDLQRSQQFLQQELARHGRMTELARQRSHIALNTLQKYEFRLDLLFKYLREREVEIRPELTPQDIMQLHREKMDEVEKLERLLVEQAIKARPSEGDVTHSDGAF